MNYGWILPVAVVFLSIGIALTISAWIAYDKRRDNRIKLMVLKSDSWCSENCKAYEYCHSNNKDPDDAWKELEEYCWECPMAKAMDEWATQKLGREKK